MIKTVIRLKNDMVMAFDTEGEQVPEYQGQYEDVKEDVLRDAPLDAVFAHWLDYAMEQKAISKESW